MLLPNHVSPVVKVYYGKPVLPEVSRVHACLYEKDFKLVAFEDVDSVPIDLIRLQASTSVPAPFFEDGSKFLFESRAICRYVSETYADRGNRYLLGHDLLDRVSIEQWLKSEEQSFDPPSRALVLHLAFPPSTKSYNDLLEESERLAEVLDVYNHRLGESRYLAGDEFTLADLTHLPNSQYIATSYEWGYLFDERENLKRWWKEVSIRPSWSQVVEEIERSEEESDDEMAAEKEKNSVEITRQPAKMSLKASIFHPIEASVQPVKPKSTFTISKNVASPRGSVQVTVPDKRGFSVPVPEKKGAEVETTRIQSHSTPHAKQPVADAEVTMEEPIIPLTGTQKSHTARIDKASTELTGVVSQSTNPETHAQVKMEGSPIPPTAAQIPSTDHIDKVSTETTRGVSESRKPETHDKVTIEGSTIPSTGTQIPSTARIFKASTETTRVVSQSTKPETHDKVTIEGSTIPPTGTQIPSTDRTDKASTESTRVVSQSTKSVTDAKVKMEKTLFPPTHETTTESPKSTEKDAASLTDETSRSKSSGLPFRQAPPTSKTVQPTDETSMSKSRGMEVPPTHETTTESPKATEKDAASPTDETSTSKSRGLPSRQAPPLTSKTVQPTSRSLEGTQTPSTEKSTTKNQGQTSATYSKQGHAGEKLTSKQDETEINAEAYLAAKHKEWQEQWHQPEKFGEEKHADGILAQKPRASNIEETATTLSPNTTTSSETARQELVTGISTDVPAQEPSESRTTTKPKDTSPATQSTTILAASQDPALGKTTGASTAPTANPQASLSPSVDESQGGISDETNNALAPKPPKHDGTTHLTTETPATETTSRTARSEPSKEPSKSTIPVTQVKSFPGTTTTKTEAIERVVTTQNTTIPTATQAPRSSSTNETTGVTSNKSNNVPTQSPTAVFPPASPKSMTDKSNTLTTTETSKLTVQATQEDTSRGAINSEPKEKSPLTTESQKSSNETAGKNQTPPATRQTPPYDKRSAGIKDVFQPKKAPAEETSRGTGNDLVQNSQAATQKIPPVYEDATKPPATPDTEKVSPVDTTGTEKTRDEASSMQTPLLSNADTTAPTSNGSSTAQDTTPQQKKNQNETKMENKTEPDQLGTNKPNQATLQPNKTNDSEKRRPVDETGTKKGGELSKDKASSSQKETAPTSDGSSTAPDTTQQKQTQNETKMETDTEPDQLGTNKPNQTTLQPNKTNDTEKRLPVDETGTEKGGELSKNKASSSPKETAPTSDGSSNAADATPKLEENLSETKTEPDQLGTNKPNQTTSQSNKTNDDNLRNEALFEINQNKASPQDKEPTSSNESPPKPRTKQNGEFDSNKNPGPANKE